MKYSVKCKKQAYFFTGIFCFVLFTLCCLPAAAPANDPKVDSILVERVNQQGTLPVIVRLRDSDLPGGFSSDMVRARQGVIGSLQSMVLDDVSVQTARAASGLHVKRFSTIPAMALHVDAAGLEALRAHPDVVEIVEDALLEPSLHDSVELIGGERDGSFGTYTGQGQTIAIIDTGVDKNHPFLSGKVVSEACYSTNKEESGVSSLCPGKADSSTAPDSGLNCESDISLCGHGTNVAGVAAGRGDTFSGVAKDASIIAIQVYSRFSDCGDYVSSPCLKAYSSDVISGLERVYALRDTYSIASVNMSLGSGQYESVCDSSLYRPIIDSLRAVGIATVVASGNGSSTTGISSPACVSSSISVGSTTKSDEVSSFSNSADMLSLLAPGSSISTSVPGTTYGAKSGTSIAAPHVAGAWAVFKQAKPDAGVAEVLDALQSTGEPVRDTRSGANSRVTPRIDVHYALSAVSVCEDSADCDDGIFCNGVERCQNETCVAGPVPCAADMLCDEQISACTLPECEIDRDCFEGEVCSQHLCAEEVLSELVITYKAPVAEKLKKDKKLKLKIIGGEGFDPYGDIIVGTFAVLKKKPKVKFKQGVLVKNELQVTVLVPAGYPSGTVEVRTPSCSGLIEIL